MDYKLTGEEINEVLKTYNRATTAEYVALTDAASKKACNQTIKEVRDWLEACGLELMANIDRDFIGLRLGKAYAEFKPSNDDPNRFFPKEAR